jgi:hypothetical protein
MKKILLLISFLYSSFIIGQNSMLVPPEAVTSAFERQNPNKVPSWSIEYGKNDQIYFEGAFTTSEKKKAFAVYDRFGAFKSLKTQVSIERLSSKAQTYLKKNYPAKNKVMPVGKILSVIDDKNTQTFIAEVKKDKKYYNIVFNKDGEFVKRTEIDYL